MVAGVKMEGMSVCILLALLSADPAADKLNEFLNAQRESRKVRLTGVDANLKIASEQLAEAERGVVRTGFTKVLPPGKNRDYTIFPSLKVKGEYVDAAKGKVEQHKADRLKITGEKDRYPAFTSLPEAGDVAEFHERVNVFQVLGKDSMLIRIYPLVPAGVKVVGKVAIQKYEPKEVLLMARGVDTSGVSDGAGYEPRGLFEVTGTETYRTASGAKSTVLVVAPFDMKRLKK